MRSPTSLKPMTMMAKTQNADNKPKKLFVVFKCRLSLQYGIRDGASPEKFGWKRDTIDGQKLYLTMFTSFLLRNEYRREKGGGWICPPHGTTLVWDG